MNGTVWVLCKTRLIFPRLNGPNDWFQNAMKSGKRKKIYFLKTLRVDVSKYRPEVCKSEKLPILKKIHKVALGKLLT